MPSLIQWYLISGKFAEIDAPRVPLRLMFPPKPAIERPDEDDDMDTSAGSRIKKAFKGACKRAGIADFTPHGCRHTWASWHYIANRDLKKLQQLGADSGPSRTVIPTDRGQRSGDCGQFPMSV